MTEYKNYRADLKHISIHGRGVERSSDFKASSIDNLRASLLKEWGGLLKHPDMYIEVYDTKMDSKGRYIMVERGYISFTRTFKKGVQNKYLWTTYDKMLNAKRNILNEDGSLGRRV